MSEAELIYGNHQIDHMEQMEIGELGELKLLRIIVYSNVLLLILFFRIGNMEKKYDRTTSGQSRIRCA